MMTPETKSNRPLTARVGALLMGAMTTSLMPSAAWGQTATFTPLGDLSGGAFRSTALGVSNDGSVVVGRGESSSGQEAFIWTADTGMVGLGVLGGNAFFFSQLYDGIESRIRFAGDQASGVCFE